MKRIIGILLMTLLVLPGCNFLSPSDNSSTSSTEFVLKFQNTGSYAIRALYITKDTGNWGSNATQRFGGNGANGQFGTPGWSSNPVAWRSFQPPE